MNVCVIIWNTNRCSYLFERGKFMDYKQEIKQMIDETSDEEKIKMIYRIIKRYLGAK